MGIYIPAAGETNYDASFAVGMANIDQHDHTGGPTNGVLINTSALADGSVTYNKLASNVADPTTGVGVNGGMPNQIILLGILPNIFNISTGVGFIAKNGTAADAFTITGTAGEVAVASGDGTAGNPTLSLAPIVTKTTQPAFLANADTVSNVTGDGTLYTVTFGAGGANTFDQNGDFDGTSTFTVPTTGIYLVQCTLNMTTLTVQMTTGLIKISVATTGAVDYPEFNGNPGAIRNLGNGLILSISQLCKLQATATVTVSVTLSNGAKVAGIQDGTFSAIKIW